MRALVNQLLKSSKSSILVYNSERIIPGEIPENILRMHLARYSFAQGYATNSLVLDVASGAGYGSKLLSGNAKDVVGGDLSFDAVRYGQENWKTANLSYMALDGHRLPFREKTFDLVVSFETIEHLSEFADFISECKRVLKIKGLFVCSTCNRNILTVKWRKPLNPFHVNEFSQIEFMNLLKKYFDKVELHGQLFLGFARRFAYMLYYTLGFIVVRLKILPFLQPLLTLLTRHPIKSFSSNMAPRKISSRIKSVPGYIIAVCTKG